jgi:hypothetical protein
MRDHSATRSPGIRRALAGVLTLAFLALAPVAAAEPIQEFNVQIKDIKPGGQYTVVFTANSYDTTGEPPPLVTDNIFRFAAGVRIRPEFLTKGYHCKVDSVREMLLTPDGKLGFTARLRKLAATLKRVRSKLPPAKAREVETCIRAQIGEGNVIADVRPTFDRPVPANFFVYLAKPKAKGADAAFGIIVVLDENGWLFKEAPLLRTFRLPLHIDLFDEPSSDGRYGYKLILPGGGAGGVRASVAELRVTTKGISQTKKTITCQTRSKGRCTKRKVATKKLFWLTQPTCPTSGQLGFESFYKYETGTTFTKTVDLPCPRFQL